MSCDNLQKPYQQRFKGIENFLRRVAFNLGNTPSQTEVKIISCIPIDVTDLQQKIINLEKQLLETQGRSANTTKNAVSKPKNNEETVEKHNSNEKTPTVVNTALYGTNFARQLSTISFCSNQPIGKIRSNQAAAHCVDCSSRGKRSNVSFVVPSLTKTDAQHFCTISSNKDNGTINRCKNIFKARKKKAYGGKPKIKTHLVYYAHQTAENPFKINDVKFNQTSLSNSDEICLSYLNNVIRRQYDPNEVVEEFSDTSNFTRPICRETAVTNTQYESDVCSCCHGTFQNIDNYITKTLFCEPINEARNRLSHTELFYDSNNYDIIPVKDKNYNKKKGKTAIAKNNFKMKCGPENIRPKLVHQPLTMNFEAKIPINQGYKTKQSEKVKNLNISAKKIVQNKLCSMNTEHQMGMETSKSCCIEFGDTYPKIININPKPLHFEPVRKALKINESIETEEVVNKLQGVNQSTQLELNSTDDSKVLTLNEIKTALQSVLEEIKTSTKLNVTDKTTQQNVVQKESSKKSLEGESELLHSYTYNKSYNTNPYIASCSRHIPHASYCYASVPYQPMKLFQNFPVFIQPAPGRHMCACYYRKSSSKPKNKTAASTHTNTDEIKNTSSKETEKLIKEIYKSIALNMDYPTKETSSSEYHNPSSSEIRNLKNEQISSRQDNKIGAELSPFELHANQRTLVYTAASTQSEDRSDLNESHLGYEDNLGINNYKTTRNVELQSIGTINEDKEVSASSSETESDETVVLEEFKQNVKRKKGFFNRMLKSVRLFKKKKDIEKQQSDIVEESDSDDYETVYSESTPSRQQIEQAHTKDRNGRHRSPYLEQEYRRQWNEYLMFREQEKSKHSSERPYSKDSTSKNKPVYWSKYEARSAIVDHKGPAINNITVHNQVPKSNNVQNEKFAWLKKHKLGINCGEQWKKFILEN